MSSQRLLNRTVISRLAVALAAPAFALATLAASGGLSASAAAQPVWSTQASSLAKTDSALHTSARTAVAHSSATQLTKHRRRHRRLTPKQIAWKIMRWFHWKPKWQFKYLNKLWMRESSWNVHASNPYSGAYGIPQAVPGSKMASVAKNWRNSPKTQIRWGMRYIKSRYGSPKHAWIHEVYDGWY